MAAATELAGGVSAELRIFLDTQLDAGDVLVDVEPGFGFVALSAVTAPAGTPSVFVLERQNGSCDAMQVSARDAGGWVEPFPLDDLTTGALTDLIVARLPHDGSIFVHASPAMLPTALQGLAPLVLLGRVAACCLSIPPDVRDSDLQNATALLHALGFMVHAMHEHDGEPQLFAVPALSRASCAIALAGALPQADIAIAPRPDMVVVHDPRIAPADVGMRVLSAPAQVVAPPAFSFIAPYCRTGYGVVGAHLLREFLLQDAPVAYFPLGHIDGSVVKSDLVKRALARQGSFNDSAPSVRLSQQFDLAMHVGRGPRIGFPIFELDQFHAYERHHLERQDRLLVTCEWARHVLLENGIANTPIDIIPLGVDRAVFHEHVAFTATTTDTVFMSVGKLERRKGQRELLTAFETAFTPHDAVRLVLVCHNAFVDEKTFADMVHPFRTSPMASRITLVTTPLATQRDLATVMASADCAVFPARAEGWNLEALEMLSMGKPVIATDCTGHTAYLTTDNARLIAVDALEPSVPDAPSGRWAAWGERQHEQLVVNLRDVHCARQHDELAVNVAGIRTAERLSWAASANTLMRSVLAA